MAIRRARIGLALALLALCAPLCAQEFDALSTQQQDLLSPLAEHWALIPPPRRQGLLEMADRVAGQSPRAQERFRGGLRRFLAMEAGKRQQVRKLFERFRHLPLREREETIRRVMAMPDEQRRAFALGMRIADRTHRLGARQEDWLSSLPPERRRALQAELRELSPPDRLRRIADEMESTQEPQRPGSR